MSAMTDRPRGESFYRMEKLSKKYLDNLALKDIDLAFERGRISGLIGKNGAGKSTLVNIMYGALEPTSGKIHINGRAVSGLSPSIAQQMGVFLIPQKVQHAHDLSIAENLFLGRYPRTRLGLVDVRGMRRSAEELMAKVGLTLSPATMLGRLSIEQRRLLDVAKALWVYDAQMIILDETTAALGFSSKRILFDILRRAKGEDRSVVFITHRLKEIMEICDSAAVLRDGGVVGTRDITDISMDALAEMIIGRKHDVDAERGKGRVAVGDDPETACLKVKNLTMAGVFENITFHVHKNEIIGVAGMLGSGYNDILRCMGGVESGRMNGEILMSGGTIKRSTPEKLARAGICYLTSNREEEGLLHTMTVEENMFCGTYRHFRNRIGLLDRRKIRKKLEERVRLLDIQLHSPTLLIDSLSGGNKQKVMVSRLLNQQPDVIFLDEPAEGIDIEARARLLQFIDEVAREGKLVIIASNVVEDLMTICDRILVVRHGRISDSFRREEFDEQRIYNAIQGL
jgi:ribose transport system ATP-binding protein